MLRTSSECFPMRIMNESIGGSSGGSVRCKSR